MSSSSEQREVLPMPCECQDIQQPLKGNDYKSNRRQECKVKVDVCVYRKVLYLHCAALFTRY